MRLFILQVTLLEEIVMTKKIFPSYCMQFIARVLSCVFIVLLYPAANNANAGAAENDSTARGKLVYDRFCSLCHGKNLQGQPDWRTRKLDGKLPAPPHDETGHTWHHPDKMLFDITKYGLVPPNAPENYKTDMPAWGGTLKDKDIWSVIAYIKSRWPEDIREKQKEVNSASLKNR